MFKKSHPSKTAIQDWKLSPNHPSITAGDVEPLSADLGDISSLPHEYAEPVSNSFIIGMVEGVKGHRQPQNADKLIWFNAKIQPNARLRRFLDFVVACKPNEMVWVFSRYKELVFSILYDTFTQGIEYLNCLPERPFSPSSEVMEDIWKPYMCLHKLIELLPKLVASGWHQEEIESMLIVALDHGNNQDVRMLGLYTLCIYMVALRGKYSEMAIDLFTNAISLRAFTYADKEEACQVVGDIMCVIANGVDVTSIGCGQRTITGFKWGQASICPVLQDTAHPINPQGILALRMVKDFLALLTYLASLVEDPQAAYTEYASILITGRIEKPFDFTNQRHLFPTGMPTYAPMMACSSEDIELSLKCLYHLFRKAYLAWIYPAEEGTLTERQIRPMPLLGLHVFINFMMNSLVPRKPNMLTEDDFHVPYINKQLYKDRSSLAYNGVFETYSKIYGGIESMCIRAYDILRPLLLDGDIKSSLFFVDVLRLSLVSPIKQEADHSETQEEGTSEMPAIAYECCIGALTIIRLWMTSKYEYRPAHFLVGNNTEGVMPKLINDYINSIHDLLDWIVDDGIWTGKKIHLLYNGLLVHRAVLRLYRNHIPEDIKVGFADRLHGITIKFLSTEPQDPDKVCQDDWLPNRALTLLSECTVSGYLVMSFIELYAPKLKELFNTPTSWRIHYKLWSNVLQALTIARGKHILHVDERTLIQESMFSGRRHRKGISKVDAYLSELKSPTYHLNNLHSKDCYKTSTPFSITSFLTWDTMANVFRSLHRHSQDVQTFQSSYQHGTSNQRNQNIVAFCNISDHSVLHTSLSPCIYTHVFHSSRDNLQQISKSRISIEELSKTSSRHDSPPRVFRRNPHNGQSSLNADLVPTTTTIDSKVQDTGRKARFRSFSRPSAALETEDNVLNTNASVMSVGMLGKMRSAFRPKKDTSIAGGENERLNAIDSDEGGDGSRVVGNVYEDVMCPESRRLQHNSIHGGKHSGSFSLASQTTTMRKSRSGHGEVSSSRIAFAPDPQQSRRSSYHSENPMSIHIQGRHMQLMAIGPAKISVPSNSGPMKALRNLNPHHHHHSYHSHKRQHQYKQVGDAGDDTRAEGVKDVDEQKMEVCEANSKAAAGLIGNLIERVWQSEAIWPDFHISYFVNAQANAVDALQKQWLVWVSLLGSPAEAEEEISRIILHGLVNSWDVYRTVLDCSQNTPDNDDVIISIAWWIADMATSFNIDDDRGRTAQTAIFRIGCRFSDYLTDQILFLRSRFLQTALISLSSFARDQPPNVDQIQILLVEAPLMFSLGVSGARLCILSLELALNRVLLSGSISLDQFSEMALRGAATLLASLATLLCSDRVLNANHNGPRIRPLAESNLTTTLSTSPDSLTKVCKDGIVTQDKFPMMYLQPGSYKYKVVWENGGAIFGRSCNIMWRMLLDRSYDGKHSEQSCFAVEASILSSLAVVCFTELAIENKELQNKLIIDNCLQAIYSRLFDHQVNKAIVAINCLTMFIIGQNNIVDFLGMDRVREMAMVLMMSLVEFLDRAFDEFAIDHATVVRAQTVLLQSILIKAPEIITMAKSSQDYEQAQHIRDFLFEKVIPACTNPLSPNVYQNHEYNHKLVSTSFSQNNGIKLAINTASYILDGTHLEPVEKTNKAESIKFIQQMGEALYISLMYHFDEEDRTRFKGPPGSGFEQTHINLKVDDGFDSERVCFYSHGNSIIKIYSEPDTIFCRFINRGCNGKHAFRAYYPLRGFQARQGHTPDTRPNKPCTIAKPNSEVYGKGDTETSIPVVSSLISVDAIKAAQKDGQDVSQSTRKPNGLYLNHTEDERYTQLCDEIKDFMKREADAVHDDSLPYIDSRVGRPLSPQAKDPEKNASDSEENLAAWSEADDNMLTNPQKMNLFRDFIEHRLVFKSQRGILNYYVPLVKSDALFRDINALDRIHPCEAIKIAVFYVGPGQWTEAEILSNTTSDTSLAYQSFVSGLGWKIDLKTFLGYTGKLENDGSDGDSCCYFADEGMEVVFHEVTSMPNDKRDIRQIKKKRHVGNDHVHIIWNESQHNYPPETISGDFGNVQIQIQPLEAGEYGIRIYCDERVRPFGPLTNGVIVPADTLPAAVRATAVNGYRHATEAFFRTFTHPFASRQHAINRIVEKHIDKSWVKSATSDKKHSIGI